VDTIIHQGDTTKVLQEDLDPYLHIEVPETMMEVLTTMVGMVGLTMDMLRIINIEVLFFLSFLLAL